MFNECGVASLLHCKLDATVKVYHVLFCLKFQVSFCIIYYKQMDNFKIYFNNKLLIKNVLPKKMVKY